MHSSRMRTGRSLTVCCSLLPGGVLLGLGGVSLPGGGSPCQVGVSAWSGGVSLPGGVSAWSQGGPLETPPVYRITDTCKNITLATTSLRPVIIPLIECDEPDSKPGTTRCTRATVELSKLYLGAQGWQQHVIYDNMLCAGRISIYKIRASCT